MLNNSHKNSIELLTERPLISVGIPTFNRPKMLRRTLECIIGQTYTNLEIIVSDNCSSGSETEAVVREFILIDKRIQYFRQAENIGGKNTKFLIEKATSEYFMLAADDDEWDKNFIEYHIKALLENKDCIVAFCPYHYIDENGIIRGNAFTYNYSSRFTFIRLCKFLWYYDDAFLYGLYKRKYLTQVKWVVWWSINAKCPINGAYPPCFFFLSAGNFVLADTTPLWYFRQYFSSGGRHYIPYVTEKPNPILAYLAFILRKINLGYESMIAIWRGSHSIMLVIFMVFPLTTRFIYDCTVETIHMGKWFFRIIKKIFIRKTLS
jgi:glycosyltransferase involved in cell wall biosynthesis